MALRMIFVAGFLVIILAALVRADNSKAGDEAFAVSEDSQAASAPRRPVNALWNNGHGSGIWIYDSHVSCIAGYPTVDHFLVLGLSDLAINSKEKSFDESRLHLCAAFTPASESTPIDRCTGGTIAISYLGAEREYMGKYEFLLRSGRRVSGEFRAIYCAEAHGY